MPPDLLKVHSLGVSFYVLKDPKGLYLLDGGFLFGISNLNKALVKRGWDKEPILGIIVTHGHLDHTLNIAKLSEKTGAWIAAPRLDALHYDGRVKYTGITKIIGFLESFGRRLLGFRSFEVTRFLDDGDVLDLWHGLRVVHLPGHTMGHSGFYCERLKLLFCADLFASFDGFSHLPPKLFNVNNSEAYKSSHAALALDLKGLLPNHSDNGSAETHLKRLQELIT